LYACGGYRWQLRFDLDAASKVSEQLFLGLDGVVDVSKRPAVDLGNAIYVPKRLILELGTLLRVYWRHNFQSGDDDILDVLGECRVLGESILFTNSLISASIVLP